MKAMLVIELNDDVELDYTHIGYVVQDKYGSVVASDLFEHSFATLKPIPKKYQLTTEKGNRYAVGYNDCIDEILGEEE